MDVLQKEIEEIVNREIKAWDTQDFALNLVIINDPEEF